MPPRGGGEIPVPAAESDRAGIESLLRRCGLFREAEIRVALEVVDVYLYQSGQDDYRIHALRGSGEVLGYVCFGRNHLTAATWELYWIAVDPGHRGRGLGSRLMDSAETRARGEGGIKMVVETSSRKDYLPTLTFYRNRGYLSVARVPDFYGREDDKLILVKELGSPENDPS